MLRVIFRTCLVNLNMCLETVNIRSFLLPGKLDYNTCLNILKYTFCIIYYVFKYF